MGMKMVALFSSLVTNMEMQDFASVRLATFYQVAQAPPNGIIGF